MDPQSVVNVGGGGSNNSGGSYGPVGGPAPPSHHQQQQQTSRSLYTPHPSQQPSQDHITSVSGGNDGAGPAFQLTGTTPNSSSANPSSYISNNTGPSKSGVQFNQHGSNYHSESGSDGRYHHHHSSPEEEVPPSARFVDTSNGGSYWEGGGGGVSMEGGIMQDPPLHGAEAEAAAAAAAAAVAEAAAAAALFWKPKGSSEAWLDALAISSDALTSMENRGGGGISRRNTWSGGGSDNDGAGSRGVNGGGRRRHQRFSHSSSSPSSNFENPYVVDSLYNDDISHANDNPIYLKAENNCEIVAEYLLTLRSILDSTPNDGISWDCVPQMYPPPPPWWWDQQQQQHSSSHQNRLQHNSPRHNNSSYESTTHSNNHHQHTRQHQHRAHENSSTTNTPTSPDSTVSSFRRPSPHSSSSSPLAGRGTNINRFSVLFPQRGDDDDDDDDEDEDDDKEGVNDEAVDDLSDEEIVFVPDPASSSPGKGNGRRGGGSRKQKRNHRKSKMVVRRIMIRILVTLSDLHAYKARSCGTFRPHNNYTNNHRHRSTTFDSNSDDSTVTSTISPTAPRWLDGAAEYGISYDHVRTAQVIVDAEYARLLELEEVTAARDLDNNAPEPPVETENNQHQQPDTNTPNQIHTLMNALTADAEVLLICLTSFSHSRQTYLTQARRRESQLRRKLEPQWSSRNEVRERMGEERWCNNPAPKNEFARVRRMDERELRELRRGIELVVGLEVEGMLGSDCVRMAENKKAQRKKKGSTS